MQRSPFCVCVTLTALFAVSGHASTIFYTARSVFDVAQPGLALEGFESAKLSSYQFQTLAGPLSRSTNNTVFSANSILAGLSVTSLQTSPSQNLVAIGADAVSGSSKAVGTNQSGDTLILNFSPTVTAVAADVFASDGGFSLGGSFTVQLFNGTTLLGSTTISEPSFGFTSFGAVSTTAITSVRIVFTGSSSSTFVDNVEFGRAAVSTPESDARIPTLLGLALCIGRAVSVRRLKRVLAHRDAPPLCTPRVYKT